MTRFIRNVFSSAVLTHHTKGRPTWWSRIRAGAVAAALGLASIAGAQTQTTTTLSTSANPVASGQTVTLAAAVSGSSPSGSVVFRDDANYAKRVAILHFDGANNSTVITGSEYRNKTWTTAGNAKVSNVGGVTSLALDGSGDWVSTTTNLSDFVFGTGDFELRVKIRTTVADKVVLDFYTNSQAGWQLYIEPGGRLQWWDSGARKTGSVVVTDGTWHDIEVTRVAGVLYFYVDANLDGAGTPYTANLSYQPSAFSVGAQVAYRNGTYDFNGQIDEVRISKGVGGDTGATRDVNNDGSVSLGTAALSGGVATVSASLADGLHQITALYQGDATNASSSPAPLVQLVGQSATSTGLTASPNPTTVGQPVTMSATVGGFNPTGSVTFKDGGVALGSGSLAGNTATFTTASLTIGSHSITAVYAGDINNLPSSSAAFNQTVNKAPTTTGLTSSSNPSGYAQSVTYTATVAGGVNPGGTVTFKDGSTTIGTGTLSSGVATFATGSLAGGAHSITAQYVGDALNAMSTSSAINQIVNKYVTTASLASTPNPSFAGQGVMLTASVAGSSPTGSVTFKDGATVLATSTLTSGVATFTSVTLGAGTHSLTAVYAGDGNNAAATSPAVIQQVGPATASMTLSGPDSGVAVGGSAALTAKVNGFQPSGLVTFTEGSSTLGSVSVAGGIATLNVSGLSLGTHTVSASYPGDVNNTAAASESVSFTVIPPSAYTWQYGYDAMGRTTTVLDPNNQAAHIYYDGLGRVIQTQQPANTGSTTPTATDFAYNLRGDLTQVTDSRGLATTYTPDATGNVTAQTSPDTGASQYTYDANGNVLTKTDARGKVTTYTYDGLDRVKSISYATGAPTTFEYDGGATPTPAAIGKLTKMTDESGFTTTYAYDSMGRLATKTMAAVTQSGPFALTVGYTWGDSGSALDKVTAVTYPSGTRINYSYDQYGNVSGITVNPVNANGQGVSGTATTLLSGITYNADARITGWLWSDGKARTMGYDANGMVASYNLGDPVGAGTAAGLLRTILRDAAGRITGYTHTNNGSPVAGFDQTFGYDNLDRLTSSTQGSTSTQYSYDDNGNRTARTIGGTAYPNVVSTTSNRLDQVQDPTGTATIGHDAAGNIVGDGGFTYTYSDRGRMASVTTASGVVGYLYNGLEQRVRKSGPVSESGPAWLSYFVYDEAGQLLGEYDISGKPVYETVYLGSMPVGVLKQTGSAATSSLVTTVYNVHADHIDTPRVITKQDETIVWRWDGAEAFGATAPDQNPTGQGTFVFNQRFPGQVFDQETGLFQNWNRDYRAAWGRYIQSDPIGLDGGTNTFTYVDGNPLSRIDPQGLLFTTVDAYCLRHPQDCSEIIGDIVRSAGELSGNECVAEAADSAADAISDAGQFLGMIGGLGKRPSMGSGRGKAKAPGSSRGPAAGLAAGPAAGPAAKQTFTYDPRVRQRAVEDPSSHNFPHSFDDVVLSTKPELKADGYRMYRHEGSMTGSVKTDPITGVRTQTYKDGVFEIGVTKDGVINHRFFRPNN